MVTCNGCTVGALRYTSVTIATVTIPKNTASNLLSFRINVFKLIKKVEDHTNTGLYMCIHCTCMTLRRIVFATQSRALAGSGHEHEFQQSCPADILHGVTSNCLLPLTLL